MLSKRRRTFAGDHPSQNFEYSNDAAFSGAGGSDSLLDTRAILAESSADELGKDDTEAVVGSSMAPSAMPTGSDQPIFPDSWSLKVLEQLQERFQELHALKCKFDILIGEHVFDARRGSSARSLIRNLEDSPVFKQMMGPGQSKNVCADLRSTFSSNLLCNYLHHMIKITVANIRSRLNHIIISFLFCKKCRSFGQNTYGSIARRHQNHRVL